MSCDRMPAEWPAPLPRLAVLPGDPPALRRWLHAQTAEPGVDDLWPEEEP